MSARKYVLYWEAGSGAMAPEAMLEEFGVEYERVHIDMARDEHHGADYLALNPTGQIPALRLPDGTCMAESAAMVLVLGEHFPAYGLVPVADESDRPVFLRWLLFLATSVYMTFVRLNHPERFTIDPAGSAGVREAALASVNRQFSIIDDAIAGSPWFLRRGFSALDIYLTMLADWHPDREGLFRENAKVAALYEATCHRPACARVVARYRESD